MSEVVVRWCIGFVVMGWGCSGGETEPCEATLEGWSDADGDGFGAGEPEAVCKLGDLVDNGSDCNDDDPAIFPGAEEQCNGVDDDCNGELDNGQDLKNFYADADGDGFGFRFPAQLACENPGDGWVKNQDDCDDEDPDIHPDAQEVCNAGVDDDCDGLSDDQDESTDPETKTPYFIDEDLDGLGDRDVQLDLCAPRSGYVDNDLDCDDSDETITQFEFYEDADLDGYGQAGKYVLSCAGYEGASNNDLDCDDSDPLVNIPQDWYADIDGDGWGTGSSQGYGCFPPSPDTGPNLGDCDEGDPLINGGMLEVCDDGIDQNCNADLDCMDTDCFSDPMCMGPCVDDILPAPPNTQFGSTVGQGDDTTPICAYSNSSDVVYQFTAPAAGTYMFDTQGSGYDTVLAAFTSCAGAELACDDDGFGIIGGPSRIQVNLAAGQTIIVAVEGYATSQGNYTLNVQ